MNISSVSSTSNNNYFKSNSNSEVAKLEQEKASLQNEIQQINQSKDDEKTKQQKIKEIQAQIQIINQEIAQKKSEETKSSEGQNKSEETLNIRNSGSVVKENILDVLV